MTIETWLKQAREELETAGIGTARLDSLVLLEDQLNTNRTHLLAHPETELTNAQIKNLESKIARRAKHEPLAYIRGFTNFYGRELLTDKRVLEPRPESETMIGLLLKINDLPVNPSIADVGTGSGALGITASLEMPKAQVDLLEIDEGAIGVAKDNVIKFATSINVIRSDLLLNSTKNYDVLLCNLPYVPDGYQINKAAEAEPRLAIFGGKDGLDIYRKLFKQVHALSNKPLYILTEALPPQHDKLKQIATKSGYSLNHSDDFIQVFKKLNWRLAQHPKPH